MHDLDRIQELLELSPSRVPRDPVSTAIGLTALIEAAVGSTVTIWGTAYTAAQIGGAVLAFGASLALSAASLALQDSAKKTTLPGGIGVAKVDEGTRQPQIVPIPEQRLVLGTATTSGALFFRRSKPPYLWRGFLLAAHECGDFVDLILNGKKVPLNANGEAIAQPYYDGSTAYIQASYRNGTADQAMDPIIAADFPTMPATFRQRGHATLVLKAHYGANQNAHEQIYGSNNVFNPLIRFQGAKLFDPRVPGCLLDDPATWVWSDNASLCLMRYLYHPWPNMRLLDPGKIDWDKVAEAADIDDEWRGRKDGTKERNHTINGVILSNAEPVQTVRELLTACDGLLISASGKYYPLPGARREPVATLHQDMLAGGFELHTETPDRELINIVKTEFVAPDRDYKPVVGPVLKREDLIALDGKPLETTLTLPFTEGHTRAQRLGSRKLKDSRGTLSDASGRKAFSGLFTIEAGALRAGDIIRIDFRDFPEVNGIYQVTKTQRDESLTRVSLDLVSWSDGRFAWDAPTDEQDFVIDETVLAAEAA